MESFTDESAETVLVNGRECRKDEVPLGKEFVQNGRVFQAMACPGLYRHVKDGQRFRYGDDWYFKSPKDGPMKVNPNTPFGRPYFSENARTFHISQRVAILEVTDRTPSK